MASVTGRYYAMDRDSRWERIKLAMDALVRGEAEGRHAATGEEAVRAAYERGETDEFIKPTLVGERARIRAGDVGDLLQLPPRPRAPADPGAEHRAGAATTPRSPSTARTGTTRWRSRPSGPPPRWPRCSRSAASPSSTWRRPRSTPHVTYFFNGGEEDAHDGEERCLVDSPRDVPTYDHKPEMSAREAAAGVRRALGGAATTPSGSSTSPTPTWSATRA